MASQENVKIENRRKRKENLKKLIVNFSQVGVLLGGEENKTKQHMQDIIEFETRLANITTPQENRRDEEKLYHLMTLREMQQQAPFVSLFFNKNVNNNYNHVTRAN